MYTGSYKPKVKVIDYLFLRDVARRHLKNKQTRISNYQRIFNVVLFER